MLTKSRAKFLRRPIHKIPCHELNCNTILHTRSYNKKYCHKHNCMAKMGKQHRKNVKKRQKDIQSPYGHFHKMTERKCLKCGDPFGSISVFNKICEPCNQDNDLILRQPNNVNISSFFATNNFEGE